MAWYLGIENNNFNPRSSCEERRSFFVRRTESDYFNPRSSCEERLPCLMLRADRQYFNPRSSCEERQVRKCKDCRQMSISIHAPHARSDFNARADKTDKKFQSTLLMRGATRSVISSSFASGFQSTLLMRGATWVGAQGRGNKEISIHAPHARSDSVTFKH